jgi:glycosyltransferase involved in cell wall biosynthesis
MEGDLTRLLREAARIRLVRWDAARAPNARLLLELIRLQRIIDDERPDLVHLHSAKAGLAGRLVIRGRVATIFQPRAWSFHARAGRGQLAPKQWERFGARWADAIVCVSGGERREGEAAAIRADWRVIPNGIDTSLLKAATDDERDAARRRLGLVDAPTIVCVGRLCRQKGQDVLVRAWPRLCERVPRAQLILVGETFADGRQPSDLLAEVRLEQGIRVVGRREDVPEWLAAADVVAVPSRWEGMAYATLEAMARGRSVVTTDVSGAAECLGSEAGAIVPVEDAQALADAIADRLRDPRRCREEGQRGRFRAESLFTIERTTGAMAALYLEVVQGRSTRAPEPTAS